MPASDSATSNSKPTSPWEHSPESGPPAPGQGALPWGNLNATLTVEHNNERDSLSPLSPYDSSSVEAGSSSALYDSNQDVSAENEAELWENVALDIDDDVAHSPSLNSALDFDTRSFDGRGGVQPPVRSRLNTEDLPTINELANERKIAESNSGIAQWLDRTVVGATPSGHVRPRARTADHVAGYHRRSDLQGFIGGAPAQLYIPGPNAILREDNTGVDDDDDDDDEDDDAKSRETEEGAESDSSGQSMTPTATLEYRREAEPQQHEEQLGRALETWEGAWQAYPWQDVQRDLPKSETKSQPVSSFAAMDRYAQQARDIETASWTATLGSRRRSEADIHSIFSLSGASTRTPNIQSAGAEPTPRRLSLLQKMRGGLPRRSNSNLRKRKGPDSPPEKAVAHGHQQDSHGHFPHMKERISSWGRPKVPSPVKHDDKPVHTPIIAASKSPRAALRRVRSHGRNTSDSGGIAEIWAAAGGPPVALLSPKPNEHGSPGPKPDEEDDSPRTVISMRLEPRWVPASGNEDDLLLHIKQLNPRAPEFLVQRMLVEQQKRLRRLLESRAKHVAAVRSKICPSGAFCNSLGAGPQTLASPSRNQPGNQVVFVIDQTLFPIDGKDEDKSVQPAVFPPGIPIPPVPSLPAKFECPICYEVKSFDKPSDWTKHVHEDVQPFTCTFPKCLEARSFKRKADYQRHENERHRHLESWVCNYQDCPHVCHRRDNFIQHLVREHRHKSHEPRPGRSSRNEIQDPEIARLVKVCRQETHKQPTDEPCHFCQNLLTSWRALATHAAKHMEQISLPLLPLLDKIMPTLSGATEPAVTLARASPGVQQTLNPPLQPTFTAPAMHSGPAFVTDPYGRRWPPPCISTGFMGGPSLPSFTNSSNHPGSGPSGLAPPDPLYPPPSHRSPFTEQSQASTSSSNSFFGEYPDIDPMAFSAYGYDQQPANPAPLYAPEHAVSESPDAAAFPSWEETPTYQQEQSRVTSRPPRYLPNHQAQTWPTNYAYDASPAPSQQGQQYGAEGRAGAAGAAMSYPPPQISVSYHQDNAKPPDEDEAAEPTTGGDQQ